MAANLQGGSAFMCDHVLCDPTLSTSAKLVHGQILTFLLNDGCSSPTHAMIAKALGNMSRRTVMRATKELHERGYLEIQRRRGQGKTNVYMLTPLAFAPSFNLPYGQEVLSATRAQSPSSSPPSQPSRAATIS